MDGATLSRALVVAEKFALVIAAGILIVLVLARTDKWLYSNEVFAWTRSGIEIGEAHASLFAFKEAAVENCELGSEEPLPVCQNYQNAYLTQGFFLHPINVWFGSTLPSGYGEMPWLADLHWVAIGILLTSSVLAIALWLLLILSLPRDLRVAAAVLSILLLLLGYYRAEPTLVLPDPFAGGVRAWEAAALLVIAVVTLFGSRFFGRAPPDGRSKALGNWIAAHRKHLLLVLLAAAVLNLALPPIGAAAVQLPALAAAIVMAWWLATTKDISPLIVGSIVVLLVIVVSGESPFLLRKLETPKTQLFLVFGTYLVYVIVKPRGRLVYLLPALAAFHVPATAILSLALCLVELPLCLRRMRISPALAVSGASFVLWAWFMEKSQAALANTSGGVVSHAFALIMESPQLGPTSVVLALVAALSLWPLLRRDETWDWVARFGLMALQCLGASFVGLAISEGAPDLSLSPGYYLLIKTSNYLGPPLSFAIVVGLSLLLFRMIAAGRPSQADPSARSVWPPLASVALLILLLGLAKIDLTPRFLFIDALRNSVVHVAMGRFHPDWCRYLNQGAGFDDLYLLSARNPTNGPENAFSALKLKVRIAVGEHNADQMRVSVAMPQENGC